MNYEIFPSKKAELELYHWINFLKSERDITEMPDIKAGTQKLLAYHHDYKKHVDYEIYFARDGLSVGHLVVEARPLHTGEILINSLPQFRYWAGDPEDKIIDKPILA